MTRDLFKLGKFFTSTSDTLILEFGLALFIFLLESWLFVSDRGLV